ncbi:MAG: DEAD/DEAH box helicase [Verrucomicrobiota bacterium]
MFEGLGVNLIVPDLWQQEAVRALQQGMDVVVQAPTGSGKTYIFELFYAGLKRPAVYTVPTRALANDKLTEWRSKGWDVGIATGDIASNLNARVVVATLETQRSRFLRGDGPGLLVVDEFQMLGDAMRGVHYELAIALAPRSTQLLLLSGSVANARDVVEWLRRLGREAVLIEHTQRPVPLEERDLETMPDSQFIHSRQLWPRLLGRALRAELGPVLLFAPRRKAAEEIAQAIASALLVRDPLTLSPAQEMIAGRKLTKLIRNRVAYHHSGLGYAARAGVVEALAKAGQLNVVVATMGLAAGINFSMRSVLVTDRRYYAGNFERQVQADELLQMFGRAGRRGFDETGYALFTSHLPRLGDARPLQLRRSAPVDWPSLLGVMHATAQRNEEPFPAALRLTRSLFSVQNVPLGVERPLAGGPRPCGLWVEAERARFVRRGVREMMNSRGEWETKAPSTMASLGDAFVFEKESWRPALSLARTLDGIGQGNLCRFRDVRRYGRELPLATVLPNGELVLAKWLGRKFRQQAMKEESGAVSSQGRRSNHQAERRTLPSDIRSAHASSLRGPMTRARFETEVLALLPGWIDSGSLRDLIERGRTICARIDYSTVSVPVHLDSLGRALCAPPERDNIPAVCRYCDQLAWDQTVAIVASPSYAWRELGLIEKDGKPTPRGILFSFFQGGEGLAIAAALEEESYPLADLVFDLANIRAGPRFAGEDAPLGGRLGILCQRLYGRRDYPGYLEMGVPPQYGAGAAEVVREILANPAARHKLTSDLLRHGDIERALMEWRSLLRQIIAAPDYPQPRWRELRHLATAHVEQTRSPALAELPPLLAAQQLRRG